MPDSRRVTLRDVAKEAGVSAPQASLALNGQGRVAASTTRRVREAAERLGYRPNPVARALRSGTASSVGLVTRNLSNSYFLDVLRGMEEVTSAQDTSVVVMDSGYDVDRELEAVRRMAEHEVRALAIAPVGSSASVEWWRQNRPGQPLVLINVAPAPAVLSVGPDNVAAVEVAVDHLADRGHRRIAFVCAPEGGVADDDRTATFTARTRERGIEGVVVHTSLQFDAVQGAVAGLLADPAGPRTFLMNSDYTASAVYRAARAAGLVVGRDVSVVGHDDIPTSELLAPALTTVAFDRREVGRAAARLLLDAGGRAPASPVRLPVVLQARDSVADLRGNGSPTAR